MEVSYFQSVEIQRILGCHSQVCISVREKNANIWGYACFLGSKFFLAPDIQETFPSFD